MIILAKKKPAYTDKPALIGNILIRLLFEIDKYALNCF